MSKQTQENSFASIPLQWVGPLKVISEEFQEELQVPLATFETPLWPSVNRGAKVTLMAGGIRTALLSDKMTRSVIVEAEDAMTASKCARTILSEKEMLAKVASTTSRFIQFIDMHLEVIANLIYIRFEMKTGDASGHNMTTIASDEMISWICAQHPELKYVSISGNYCTDKKVSCVNGILGRGKAVVADVIISEKLCSSFLKTTPAKIVDLNIKKNFIGSILAGSVRSANAHFANMLLAFYLATGQDAANIIEGSQGIVHAEVRGSDLYFSVTLPNIIVGTVGNGKDLDFVQQNLERLGCTQERVPGANARRLASICAASVLCGELSLLATQTNQKELVQAHIALERRTRTKT